MAYFTNVLLASILAFLLMASFEAFPSIVKDLYEDLGDPDGQCTQAGQYLADNKNCSIFYECDAGLNPSEKACMTGLCWNEDLDTCDRPENVPCCSGIYPSSTTKGVPDTTASGVPDTTRNALSSAVTSGVPDTTKIAPTSEIPDTTSGAPQPTPDEA